MRRCRKAIEMKIICGDKPCQLKYQMPYSLLNFSNHKKGRSHINLKDPHANIKYIAIKNCSFTGIYHRHLDKL